VPEVDVARAAVLLRLWGALAREPIPGLGRVESSGDRLLVKLHDGRTLSGYARAARPFSPDRPGLSLDGAVHLDPVELLRALRLTVDTTGLERELANSVANLALARAHHPAPDHGPSTLDRARSRPDPLAYLEQSVVDGHPIHPCCRTRLGLSPAEILAYGPEHRPVIELTRVTVPQSRWYGVDCPPILWLHPWQRDHVLDGYPGLSPDGVTAPARPLMSLRTVALVDDPGHHVKTAVDVQMTSAVRTVSPAAIHNGPTLSRLITGLDAGLDLVEEVAAGAVVDNGEPVRSLALIHRRLPPLGGDELALPFAVLAAPSPATGRPIVTEICGTDPLAFVAAVVRLAIPPLLRLLEYGIALEAHGQNLLLVLRGGRPARLLYRDLGGVRVSPSRLRRRGIEAPAIHGGLATDDVDVLRTKLLASFVSTVLSEVIAVLVRECALDEERAWGTVAAVARDHGGPDVAALFDDTLPLKATTAMRLATDPLEDRWAHLPNPMAGLS
jgi:siderophore synthetase component